MSEAHGLVPTLCLQKKGLLEDNSFFEGICNVCPIMCTEPSKFKKIET